MKLGIGRSAAPQMPVGGERARSLKNAAAVAAVAVAGLLIAAKAWAWLATGSVSIMSTLLDSMLDLAASALNLMAIRQAAVPADHEHRFGHGKAEPLAGLGQSAFVAGSAALLLFEAVRRLLHPLPVQSGEIGIAVMVASIVLTIALVLFQRFVIRRTGSLAISADSLHYKADLFTNVAVLAAVVASTRFGWTAADPILAIVVAGVIAYGAWEILTQSLRVLMDRELPEDDRRRITEIASVHPGVIAMHDLRTRFSGVHPIIQLHLEMDGNLTLRQAHAIADEVMEKIEQAFPHAEVLIHEDPFGIPERRPAFDAAEPARDATTGPQGA